MKFIKLLSVSAVLLLSSGAQAAIIYDNGGPNTENGWSILGSNQINDNFSLSGTQSIRSVGFYFQNYDGITGWNQDISYNIYADNNGVTGNLIASGAGQNVTPTDSGLPWCCGGNAWLVEFDLVSTVTLAAGNYWLGLTGASSTNNAAWWVTTNYIDGSSIGGVDFAYYLDSSRVSAIPVPAAVWLFASGLMGLAGVARRRQV